MEGLNGMELGDKHLKVQLASIGLTQVSGLEMGVNAMSMLAGTTSAGLEGSRVLQLLNMVTPEELIDNEDYEGTVIPSYFLAVSLTIPYRNPRRRKRRVREVWQGLGHEDSETDWWK